MIIPIIFTVTIILTMTITRIRITIIRNRITNIRVKRKTRKPKDKISGAKVRMTCMYDHVKPTIREFNPNHIILHAETNELKSSKTASQISR